VTSGTDEPDNEIVAPSPSSAKQRNRVPYFERPKQPHDWRWVVGGIGKTLITLGLLMFAFVGYQLWGTGIQTARAQNDLESQFNKLMQSTTTVTTTTTTTVVTTDSTPASTESTIAATTTVPIAPQGPPIEHGDVIARLLIPRIDLDWYVVQGVGTDDLAKGPGHFRETPMPGQLGNAAIAGHRTTHGAPFGDLDELQPGDLITVVMANGSGTFTYSVTGTIIVSPSEYAKVIPTIDFSVATLTLATCHPEFTSKQRMIVQAVLVPEQSSQVMAPPPNTVPVIPDETLPAENPETTVAAAPGDTTDTSVATTTTLAEPVASDTTITEDGLSGGWFDDSAAIPHALLWGLALLAVGVGAYFVGKASNRLYVSFIVGFIPFVVVLYFFFENVNRLLPPGL
jgi:sortase A